MRTERIYRQKLRKVRKRNGDKNSRERERKRSHADKTKRYVQGAEESFQCDRGSSRWHRHREAASYRRRPCSVVGWVSWRKRVRKEIGWIFDKGEEMH